MSRLRDTGERINIFIRILALTFLLIGVSTAYFTYVTPLIPQISPIFYFISILFIFSGALVLVAKLKK